LYVNRRLRLALFLAALAAAGPFAAPRAVDPARMEVCIAWFCSEPSVSPRQRQANAAIPGAVRSRRVFNAHPDPVLSPALLSRSLFQRPPPLQN
jgi:hypothetical protein